MKIKEYCMKYTVRLHTILLLIDIILSITLVSLNVLGIIPSWTLLFLIPTWGGYGLFVELICIWTNDKLFHLIMDNIDLDEVDLSGK